MIPRFIALCCLVVVSLFTNLAHAQRLDSLVNVLEDKYPQEKVYLHYDKAVYNPGETVWFKAYLMADNLPGALSKNLYAELLDFNGNILQKKFMPISASGAAGAVDIPDSIKTGKLFLRVYTPWMLNFDSSLVYLKQLTINLPKSAEKKPASTPAWSVQFFPEGGDLVNGIQSSVAFKAIDQDGLPASISGAIVDDKGKTIASFAPVHDGMGQFTITPITGLKYKAVWKDKKGQPHETPLPPAKETGVVLGISQIPGQINFTITRSENAAEEDKSFFVVAQMQQKLSYSARINLSQRLQVTAPILTENLPYNGIVQITVFNAKERPVAERLVFVNHGTWSFITDLHSLEKNLNKRGRNVLQIDVGQSLITNLSIAVTDAAINPPSDNETNIYAGLLLTSDLKGHVYNPAYYFSSDEDSVKEHLDLVMMTNGWRRFKWQEVLEEKFPKLLHDNENYIAIKGNVVGLTRTQLANHDITGILKLGGDKTELLSIPVLPDGKFGVDGLYFYDTAKLYYQFNNDKDKVLTTAASFLFNNAFARVNPPQPTQFLAAIAPFKIDTAIVLKSASLASLLKQQTERNKIKTLSTVVVKSKQKSPVDKLEETYTSGLFKGGDAYEFNVEGDPNSRMSMSVLRYLQGKVAGLQITINGSSSTAQWRGGTPGFFLNESRAELNQLETISMGDVAYIKVFRPPFFGAIGGGSAGAIAVYTKKGGGDNSAITGLSYTNLFGYSPIRQFYMPDYEAANDPTVGDYRSTLYWNPFILLEKSSRRVIIPFFNSDNAQKLRVIIEGINEAGQLTHEERIIQ